MKSNPDLITSLNELALHLRPVIVHVHKTPQTTQHYYAEYAAVLAAIAELDKRSTDKAKLYLGIAYAMKKAGANVRGMGAALKLMGVAT